MCTPLNNFPLLNDQYAVGIHDRAQPVRYHERRAAPAKLPKGFLNLCLDGGING